MRKTQFLSGFITCALLVSACSVEINQTAVITPVPSVESASASPSTSALPATQIPVTWSNLGLTGKLIYLSTATEGDVLTGTIQMVDLVTGAISILSNAPGAWIYYATISPDAKWIVMSYAPPGPASSSSARILYIMPLDGSTPPQPLFTPPTPDDRYTQAEWSPDGKYIGFVHYNHDQAGGKFYDVYEIFRMTYPNGTPEKILDKAFWPRFSADSTRLVYVSLDPDSGKNELWLANADGTKSQKIELPGSVTQDIIDAPLFSPDRQSILFSVPSSGRSYQQDWADKLMGVQVARAHSIPSDWWSIPVGGGTPTQLTKIQAVNLFASISPDKKHIASVSGNGIFVMDPDGSNLTQLISDPGVHGTVSWIP